MGRFIYMSDGGSGARLGCGSIRRLVLWWVDSSISRVVGRFVGWSSGGSIRLFIRFSFGGGLPCQLLEWSVDSLVGRLISLSVSCLV